MLNQARYLTLNQDFPNQFQVVIPVYQAETGINGKKDLCLGLRIPVYQVEIGINSKKDLCLGASKVINSLSKPLDKAMTTLPEDLTMTKEVNI